MLICGALAQLTVGRLVEWLAPHFIFAGVALGFAGILWAASATVLRCCSPGHHHRGDLRPDYSQRFVLARYTADAWRGRVYAVRYFLTFMVSGVAVSMIAVLYGRGGFALVLGATAVIALGFLVAVLAIALIANGVEKARLPQPAE